MKPIISMFLIISITLIFACKEEENNTLETFNDTGVLFVSGGLYDCPYQIIMNDSTVFHPFNHEVLIPFKSNQRLNFSYQLSPDSTACNGAIGIRLIEVEAIGCTPFIDTYFNNRDSLKSDPLKVSEAYIENDCLVLKIKYSGCTNDHPIDLALDHPECLTPPLPPTTFVIKHDSRNEDCKMLVTKTLSYDLTPLRENGNNIDFNVYYYKNESEMNSLSFTYFY